MPKEIATPGLESRVRRVRIANGLSQQQLAQLAGVTRQAISSIETGYYVPNTTVALRLAAALHCTVEQLFTLSAAAPTLELLASPPVHARRFAVGHVGSRWIGYPLTAEWELQPGFQSADAVRIGETAEGLEQILTPLDQLEHTAILLGCDPSLGLLSAHLRARDSTARLRWLSAASQTALDALARGEAHLAGAHLPDPDGAGYNIAHAREVLARSGGIVVEFARWELGFAVALGNPKQIHAVADLARPGVRMMNRQLGSGSRVLLDTLLARDGIPVTLVQGYDRLIGSHWSAAAAVASGGADAAITLRATAQALDLDFIPLDEVRFDFVIPRPHLAHPTVASLLEVLQSAGLRAEIGALPGYDVAGTGTIRADISPN